MAALNRCQSGKDPRSNAVSTPSNGQVSTGSSGEDARLRNLRTVVICHQMRAGAAVPPPSRQRLLDIHRQLFSIRSNASRDLCIGTVARPCGDLLAEGWPIVG